MSLTDSYLFLGISTSLPVIACCGIVIFGFYIGADGEVNFSLIGTLFGVMSSLFVSLNSIYTKKMIPIVDNNSWKLCFYVCPLSHLQCRIIWTQPFYSLLWFSFSREMSSWSIGRPFTLLYSGQSWTLQAYLVSWLELSPSPRSVWPLLSHTTSPEPPKHVCRQLWQSCFWETRCPFAPQSVHSLYCSELSCTHWCATMRWTERKQRRKRQMKHLWRIIRTLPLRMQKTQNQSLSFLEYQSELFVQYD